MKVLILTNHSYMLYQFRRELIGEIMERNEVILGMPFVGHEDEFRNMGCQCIAIEVDRRGLNPLKDIKLILDYNAILSREKPDKVITYSIKPNIYAGLLCSLKKIPYYSNVQGLGTAFQNPILAVFVGFLYKLAFFNVRTVFFENSGNAKEFVNRKLVSKRKIEVLHGAGVNLDYYSYATYPSHREEIRFLYIGRIMKEKGIDELFEAIRKLADVYGNKVKLDIVGFFEEEYKEIVKKLVKDQIVVFYGFQEDPRPFYANADCVVLPSYHEGMSNVLLEASAVGRPVITSDIPGCREAVENEKTGYVCEVKNTTKLYEKMEQMIQKSWLERKIMGQNARKRMERLFAKEKVVKRTMEKLELL